MVKTKVHNPFSDTDEIIFKDTDGRLKVVREGQVHEMEKMNEKEEKKREEKIKDEMRSALQDERDNVDMDDSFLTASIKPVIEYGPIVKKISDEIGATFDDEVLKKRLDKLILSRLKDVRDALVTKEVLTRSTKVGGVGFDQTKAQGASDIIERYYKTSHEGALAVHSQAHEALSSHPGALFGKEEERQKIHFPPPPPKPIGAKVQTVLSKTQTTLKKEVDSLINEISAKPKAEQHENRRTQEQKNTRTEEVLFVKTTEDGLKEKSSHESNDKDAPGKNEKNGEDVKAGIESVRIRPRLVGPVEELSDMTIHDFRRLDEDPKKAVKKIIEKVELLEKESLQKKFDGIEAWRQSEVFLVYRQLGKESMDSGKKLSDIISERKSANKHTLTEDEFMAVMDLSQKLRF